MEIEKLQQEIINLESLLNEKKQKLNSLFQSTARQQIDNHSPPEDKIHLFRSLFKGREDVYAARFESKLTDKTGYQPECLNEWKKGVCQEPKIRCADCSNRDFIPITNDTIKHHLTGLVGAKPFVMGLSRCECSCFVPNV